MRILAVGTLTSRVPHTGSSCQPRRSFGGRRRPAPVIFWRIPAGMPGFRAGVARRLLTTLTTSGDAVLVIGSDTGPWHLHGARLNRHVVSTVPPARRRRAQTAVTAGAAAAAPRCLPRCGPDT